jgi:uncharacterized protein (TIGR00730 family)
MPQFLYELEHADAAPPQSLEITATTAERKCAMLDRADAFIALPGGLGTLDEVFEVLSLAYLGRHAKPIVLLDAADAWHGLDLMLNDLCRRGFASAERCRLTTASSASEALDAVESLAPATAGRVS